MKKLFSIIVTCLLLASCSNNDFSGVEGAEENVEISLSLPSAISARSVASGTSAQGGVTNSPNAALTFTAAIYYGDEKVWEESKETDGATHAVTFAPRLVIGETYRLVAYAQFGTETEAVADLSAQKEAFGINDETQDAYYLDTELVAELKMSGTLTRHTGKLRLVALDYGWAMSQLDKTIKSITVTYEDGRYTTFDSHSGLWSDIDANATTYTAAPINYAIEDYANQATGPEDIKAAKTIFVDYIPVNANNDEFVSIVVDIEYNEGGTYNREINLDIPIRRNHITTLIGSFFTSEMELTLVIDEIFEGELEVEIPEYLDMSNIKTAEEFILAMKYGGEFTVTNSFTLGEGQKAVSTRKTEFTLNPGVYITVADNETGGIWNEGDLTIHQYSYNAGIIGENTAKGRRCINNTETGKLTLDGVTLKTQWNQAGAAINNIGGEVKIVDNSSCDMFIYASFYAIYNDGGKVSVENIYGDLQHKLYATSTSLNGEYAYAVRTCNGGETELSNFKIEVIHGAIANDSGSTTDINEHMTVTVSDSNAGVGDSYYAVYCTDEGSVVNVNKGSYKTVRDAFFTENNGVINVATGVVVNGKKE